MGEDQWYSNKDLYEMFIKRMGELNQELQKTQVAVRQYNGLREELAENTRQTTKCWDEIQDIKSKAAGRKSVEAAILKWGGWGIGIGTFIYNVFIK